MVDETIWIRLAIAAVLLGYAVIMWMSHLVPPPLFLGGLLALIGWLFLPGLYLLARLRRIDMSRAAQPPVKELLRPWALTAAFGAFAAATLFLAIGWDVPNVCDVPGVVRSRRSQRTVASSESVNLGPTTLVSGRSSELGRLRPVAPK